MKIEFNNRPNNSYKFGDKLVWESRSVAIVGVVLVTDTIETYVLVNQRGDGAADNRGLWNLPCGYLDWDENGHQGICREIYEETGLYVPEVMKDYNVLINYMGQPFFVNTDVKENRQNVSLSYGVCLDVGSREGIFKLSSKLTNKFSEPNEVSDVKLINIEDLSKYKFAFNHDRRIKYFLNICNNNK